MYVPPSRDPPRASSSRLALALDSNQSYVCMYVCIYPYIPAASHAARPRANKARARPGGDNRVAFGGKAGLPLAFGLRDD
eukprot:6926984-Heterocapsa_arctica.AAC.1